MKMTYLHRSRGSTVGQYGRTVCARCGYVRQGLLWKVAVPYGFQLLRYLPD